MERLGLYYFVRPGNDVPMVPAPSPVLLREGYISEDEITLAIAGEHSPDVVKGLGAYMPYMWPSELLLTIPR